MTLRFGAAKGTWMVPQTASKSSQYTVICNYNNYRRQKFWSKYSFQQDVKQETQSVY